MDKFRTGWYLIYTKPKHEKKVFQQLRESRIDSYLPTKKTLRSWRDRRKFVDEPLFPSYVFVYLNCMQSYYAGIDTEGALYYVRNGKEVARVSDAVVSNIRLLQDKGEALEVSHERFQPGRRMVIRNGPLTGLDCEVVRCDNKSKLLVRVELLQRGLLLSIAEEDVAGCYE